MNEIFYTDGVSGWITLQGKEEQAFEISPNGHMFKIIIGHRLNIHAPRVEVVDLKIKNGQLLVKIKEPLSDAEWEKGFKSRRTENER